MLTESLETTLKRTEISLKENEVRDANQELTNWSNTISDPLLNGASDPDYPSRLEQETYYALRRIQNVVDLGIGFPLDKYKKILSEFIQDVREGTIINNRYSLAQKTALIGIKEIARLHGQDPFESTDLTGMIQNYNTKLFDKVPADKQIKPWLDKNAAQRAFYVELAKEINKPNYQISRLFTHSNLSIDDLDHLLIEAAQDSYTENKDTWEGTDNPLYQDKYEHIKAMGWLYYKYQSETEPDSVVKNLDDRISSARNENKKDIATALMQLSNYLSDNRVGGVEWKRYDIRNEFEEWHETRDLGFESPLSESRGENLVKIVPKMVKLSNEGRWLEALQRLEKITYSDGASYSSTPYMTNLGPNDILEITYKNLREIGDFFGKPDEWNEEQKAVFHNWLEKANMKTLNETDLRTIPYQMFNASIKRIAEEAFTGEVTDQEISDKFDSLHTLESRLPYLMRKINSQTPETTMKTELAMAIARRFVMSLGKGEPDLEGIANYNTLNITRRIMPQALDEQLRQAHNNDPQYMMMGSPFREEPHYKALDIMHLIMAAKQEKEQNPVKSLNTQIQNTLQMNGLYPDPAMAHALMHMSNELAEEEFLGLNWTKYQPEEMLFKELTRHNKDDIFTDRHLGNQLYNLNDYLAESTLNHTNRIRELFNRHITDGSTSKGVPWNSINSIYALYHLVGMNPEYSEVPEGSPFQKPDASEFYSRMQSMAGKLHPLKKTQPKAIQALCDALGLKYQRPSDPKYESTYHRGLNNI